MHKTWTVLQHDGPNHLGPCLNQDQYESLYSRVAPAVAQLRELFGGLESLRRVERAWLRRQTSGELDDGMLVDGRAGETNVFKRRVRLPPPRLLASTRALV